jgi:WD40-like Beta Propeller Repeat
VRFIPAPSGAAIDDPIWVERRVLYVSLWRNSRPVLARFELTEHRFRIVPTLRLHGCGQTAARFPTRMGSRGIAYLADCFRPAPWRSTERLTWVGALDLGNGRNRQFGTVNLPIGSPGTLSFAPDGSRAVLANGGLYSQLNWLYPKHLSLLRQELAWAAGPTWAPDGRLIVFGGIPGKATRQDIADKATNLYAFRPEQPGKLHLILSSLRDFKPEGVAWFPGSQLFVASLEPLHESSGLWVIDARSGRKRLLLKGNRFGRPALADDGRTIAVGVGTEALVGQAVGPVGIDLIRLPKLDSLRQQLR